MHVATIILVTSGVLIGSGLCVAFIASVFYLWVK
jgi:hypothetical protein